MLSKCFRNYSALLVLNKFQNSLVTVLLKITIIKIDYTN